MRPWTGAGWSRHVQAGNRSAEADVVARFAPVEHEFAVTTAARRLARK
jgi:hypothetical protein